MMCEEVFFLSVPFRSKHFDVLCHFLSFKVIIRSLCTYTSYYGYNKFDWLTLILCSN